MSGTDFADDCRAFSITDLDGDGRADLILKSRLGPQVRVLQNHCAAENHAVAFDLQGTKSNRDAIGAKVEAGGHTVWLSAESGYLSQHSKRVLVGLGSVKGPVPVSITWPSGLMQNLAAVEPGFTYRITEGSPSWTRKPFSAHTPLQEKAVSADNTPRLRDTWFVEPLPVPGNVRVRAGLLILKGAESVPSPQGVPVETLEFTEAGAASQDVWKIFRRYLFDYRKDLQLPFCLLLNQQGRAAKVYGGVPPASQVHVDLAVLASGSGAGKALPFRGEYVAEPRRDYFKFAAALLWQGHTEAALPYLNEILRQGAESPRVLVLIARIHLEADRFKDAEPYIRKALALDPEYADAWAELGEFQAAKEQRAEALQSYEKAIALKPEASYFYTNAARVSDAMGAAANAERYYRRALEVDPQSAEAANGLGLLLAKRGQMQEARKLFEDAITLRHDFGSAINNLGALNTSNPDR